MTLDLRRIDDTVSVAPQIAPEDAAAIAAAGFVRVVNNRPDGEEPGQPSGDSIRAACEAAGLNYVAIPVGHGGFTFEQVTQTIDALSTASGPVLAYCRSGTRSCHLWGLARAGMGDDADMVIASAAGAGYDLEPARGLLDAVAAKA